MRSLPLPRRRSCAALAPLAAPILASLALLCVVRAPAGAQTTGSRWSLEVTGDAAVPTASLGGASLQTGVGFGANLRVRLQQHLSVYGGWEWHRFASDELVARATTDAEETGYTFGLRFDHPLRGERLGPRAPAYWLRAGGTANHIELENAEGDVFSDTGHGLGWEVGGGLAFPLGARLVVTPGVRYRSLGRDLTVGGSTRAVTLRYVTLGTGLVIRF